MQFEDIKAEIYGTIGTGRSNPSYQQTVVRKARLKNTIEFVAAKSVDISRKLEVCNYVDIAHDLKHPNIVKLGHWYQTDHHFLFLLEYCPGGDLESRIRDPHKMSVAKQMEIAHQIVSAVAYCHDNHIAHRDIKAENILMAIDGTPKICDFGSAECETVKSHNVFVGSLEYISPEMFQQPPQDTQKCDIWALGILLYFISTRNFPWIGGNDMDIIIEFISSGFTWRDAFPRSVAKTIKMCCKPNPEDRPTVAELLAKAPLFEVSESKPRFHSLPTIMRHYQEKLIISPKTQKFNVRGVTATWV